ncbi:MAG: hypothetical protein KBA60_00325 [Flavobacteriales bacterium]|nr:hypothetical protein [Flavobacteriales bacterium]MBP6642362.1 hypothetical protein [Flavobacteriales bacterium]MBP7154422.1 hypothetical protein [Flavobacteriales bacterium]HQV74122.1 hypothetical protein [Flavobacteriales bacterium]HQW41035.1 hypothetical protein [Flavobacteriales bacterium]
MGKQQDKRIELAKRLLDTTDEVTLGIVSAALDVPKPYAIPESEIKAFEDYLARYERGEVEPKEWSAIKRKLTRRVAK